MDTMLEKIVDQLQGLQPEKLREVSAFVQGVTEAEEITRGEQDTKAVELNEANEQKSLSSYLGILKDSPNFNEDPVELQRAMRSEWD